MKAYSEDLRQRIVRAVEVDGLSQPAVACRFAVGLRTVERYLRQWRTTGDLAARQSPGAPPAVPPADYPTLIAQLAADPDARLADHCAQWEREQGRSVSIATMQRLIRRVGWTRKKTLIASERDEAARATWREHEQELHAGEEFVFVDECGAQTNLTPRYARAPRGQRAYGRAPRNHHKNTTLVAALTHRGIGPTMAMEGAMNGTAFVAYLEQQLIPSLRPGQTVVLDNLRVHHQPSVQTLIEAVRCRVAYLPSYSPDLNPIEQAFSKIKTAVRRAEARTHEGLVDAFATALDRVTVADACNWITHSGYRVRSRQPL